MKGNDCISAMTSVLLYVEHKYHNLRYKQKAKHTHTRMERNEQSGKMFV